MSNPKRNELKCYVIVSGVKNRCRKVSREMIKLPNQTIGTDFAAVIPMATDRTNAAMKSIDIATLHLDLVEIETRDGIEFESWIALDPRHTKTQIL